MVLKPTFSNEADIKSSCQKLFNVVDPVESEQERFLNKCFALSHLDQWLLVDTRILSIKGFKYLAVKVKRD